MLTVLTSPPSLPPPIPPPVLAYAADGIFVANAGDCGFHGCPCRALNHWGIKIMCSIATTSSVANATVNPTQVSECHVNASWRATAAHFTQIAVCRLHGGTEKRGAS